MLKQFKNVIMISFFFISSAICADTIVPMHMTEAKGVGKSLGTVTISETKYGLLFTPNLHGLAPGIHGFHIHENPSCDDHANAAGGHFDPAHTGKHLGP